MADISVQVSAGAPRVLDVVLVEPVVLVVDVVGGPGQVSVTGWPTALCNTRSASDAVAVPPLSASQVVRSAG